MEAAEKIYERINSVKMELDNRILAIEVDIIQYKKENDHDIKNIKQAYNYTLKGQERIETELATLKNLLLDVKKIKEIFTGNEEYKQIGFIELFNKHIEKANEQFKALEKDILEIKKANEKEIILTAYKKWLRRVFIGLGGWVVGYIIQYLIKKYG